MKYKNPQNILLEKHKTIFFIIQKNGCSSVIAQLVEILEMKKTEYFPVDIHILERYPFPRIPDADIFPKHEDYLRFCIIRNPWERLVSCYKDKVMNNAPSKNFFKASCQEFYGGMPFEEFVEVVASLTDEESDPHFGGQLHILTSPERRLMANYFCNLENLNEHIEEVSQITGTPFTAPQRLNPTKKSSYQDFYTPKLVEKVRQRFSNDIEFFKYKFGEKNKDFSFGFLEENSETELAKAKYRIKYEEGQNLFLKKQIESIKRKMKNEQENTAKLRDSLSWKITEPLRKIGSIFEAFNRFQ